MQESHPYLQVIGQNGHLLEPKIFVKKRILVGSGRKNNIRINHEDVASSHCILHRRENHVYANPLVSLTIERIGSNLELSANSEELLEDQDVLVIGPRSFCYFSTVEARSVNHGTASDSFYLDLSADWFVLQPNPCRQDQRDLATQNFHRPPVQIEEAQFFAPFKAKPITGARSKVQKSPTRKRKVASSDEERLSEDQSEDDLCLSTRPGLSIFSQPPKVIQSAPAPSPSPSCSPSPLPLSPSPAPTPSNSHRHSSASSHSLRNDLDPRASALAEQGHSHSPSPLPTASFSRDKLSGIAFDLHRSRLDQPDKDVELLYRACSCGVRVGNFLQCPACGGRLATPQASSSSKEPEKRRNSTAKTPAKRAKSRTTKASEKTKQGGSVPAEKPKKATTRRTRAKGNNTSPNKPKPSTARRKEIAGFERFERYERDVVPRVRDILQEPASSPLSDEDQEPENRPQKQMKKKEKEKAKAKAKKSKQAQTIERLQDSRYLRSPSIQEQDSDLFQSPPKRQQTDPASSTQKRSAVSKPHPPAKRQKKADLAMFASELQWDSEGASTPSSVYKSKSRSKGRRLGGRVKSSEGKETKERAAAKSLRNIRFLATGFVGEERTELLTKIAQVGGVLVSSLQEMDEEHSSHYAKFVLISAEQAFSLKFMFAKIIFPSPAKIVGAPVFSAVEFDQILGGAASLPPPVPLGLNFEKFKVQLALPKGETQLQGELTVLLRALGFRIAQAARVPDLYLAIEEPARWVRPGLPVVRFAWIRACLEQESELDYRAFLWKKSS